MRKSKKILFGCKRKRDKFHRDLRFATRFNNWCKLYWPNINDQFIINPLNQ